MVFVDMRMKMRKDRNRGGGGGGGLVGCKIDTYVRPAPEKIDQVRWNFFMKRGVRSGGKI